MDLVKIYKDELVAAGKQVELFDASMLKDEWLTKFNKAAEEFAQKTDGWTKHLTDAELLKLEMYKLNEEWTQKLISEGYEILDIGDPYSLEKSVFYEMEKINIFK